MKIRFILIAVCFLFSLPGQADEGMWMLGNLNKQSRQTMKRVGLADVCQQAIQYETPVSEGCGSQLPEAFVPEW